MTEFVVERTCSELLPDSKKNGRSDGKPLTAYRSAQGYVLLGDPGSGKTTAFQGESDALGDESRFITARDFLVHKSAPAELKDKTLFIDGLDEVRVGKSGPRTPFDQVRELLLVLEKPKFRISCREADWLGENDRSSLEYVSGDSTVIALRLDPLTPKAVQEILRVRLRVSAPRRFIEQAREAGVDGLLANSQSLELLARAVGQGNGWPASRLETFQIACRHMARERNPGHRAAGRTLGLDELIELAGRLCSLQLISDRVGYSLDEESSSEDYPWLAECGPECVQELRVAISSKLFQADSLGCFSPVHRQIAEFLGGKYLAGLVQGGLPARRVLALMTGGDGTVVTSLRELSAWLATHSGAIRQELIANDPVGMGVYGDIHGFSRSEKRELFKELVRHPKRLASVMSSAKNFAPLVETATEGTIGEALENTNRGSAREISATFILLVMEHGRRLPSLAPQMIQIVRDASWTPTVRRLALDVLMRTQQDTRALEGELLALLTDLEVAGISPANRDLFGTLLSSLYPRAIRPERVWDYLTERAYSGYRGRYDRFWKTMLLAQSADNDVANLLDGLATQISKLEFGFTRLRMWQLPIALLKRGLVLHGDRVGMRRVYDWLGIGAYALDRLRRPPKQLPRIREWLEERPDLQKRLILTGLLACSNDYQLSSADFMIRRRLLGSTLPASFGLWRLKQAARLAANRPGVARYLFEQSFRAHEDGTDAELSVQVIEEYAGKDEKLADLLADLRSSGPPSGDDIERRIYQTTSIRTELQEKEEWLAWIRSNETALLENRAESGLLYQLGQLYFGMHVYNDRHLKGLEALSQTLGRAKTTRAAMTGLRKVLDRADLPAVDEILRLVTEKRRHNLSLPLLAALEEHETASPGAIQTMRTDRVRTYVACYLCWAPRFLGSKGRKPEWYRGLLRSTPQVVSEVALQCAAAELRGGRPVSERFWDIASKGSENAAVRDAILELLQVFPTRCNAQQLGTLDALIWTGLSLGAESHLLNLAKLKLSTARLNAGQRARWLGLGLIVSHVEYEAEIEAVTNHNERVVRQLASFLARGAAARASARKPWEYLREQLESSTLAVIVRILGRYFDPSMLAASGSSGLADEFGGAILLRDMIKSLGSKPDKVASDALKSLCNDDAIAQWKEHLSDARDAQRTIRRDAKYRHPTLQQVREALRGGPPANAGDLAAFAVDSLCRLTKRIRTGNANEWRLFWNEGAHGKPSGPKVENACRDALLALLRPELPQSVKARPEAQHANQARADLEVSSDGFRVPIEVKKNSDSKLWVAMREQLIAKYTLHPATNGYGIYLVFWFGAKRQKRRADGTCPKSPDELQARLEEALLDGESRKISVLVVDVCPPSPPRAGSA